MFLIVAYQLFLYALIELDIIIVYEMINSGVLFDSKMLWQLGKKLLVKFFEVSILHI
jgi:hypothetical protein